MNNRGIKKLTYGGLMTSLVFIATAIIPTVPIPFTEGYIHTGDSMIFITGILLGWRYGAIAGGLGSCMADLFLGYSHWAFPTLIIKGIMGAIVGFASSIQKDNQLKKIRNALSVLIGGGWIVLGVSVKKMLSSKLGELGNSEMANYLVKEFELESIQELQNLVGKIQTSLSAAIILIPLFIIVLTIFLRKKDKELFNISNLMGMTLAGVWMVVGYYFAGGILKGNMIVPVFSVPANIIQFIGGLMIAFPIALALKKTKYFNSIKL